MLEDGTVGADHRLNAGYPVNRPEKEKQTWLGGRGGGPPTEAEDQRRIKNYLVVPLY